MSPRRYSAWRFLYPFINAASDELVEVLDEPAGLSIAPTGGIEMTSEQASVRQSIMLLLSTIPGERVMRPDYGCELHRLMFSPNDNTTAGLAIHYVKQALDRWEPRVQVTDLDAGPNPEYPERLEITLEYRLRRTQETQQLLFSMNLGGD
jgi:phage baseplate assembly protein W